MKPGQFAPIVRLPPILGAFCGSHYHRSDDPFSRFNGETKNCILLYLDEFFASKAKETRSRLNTLITSEERLIEDKGLNVVVIPNRLHVIMSSNEKWVVNASKTSRRYFVLEVSDLHVQDQDFFAALKAELLEGGYQQLMRQLSKGECPPILPPPPKTEGLEQQQIRSRNVFDEWWEELIEKKEPYWWFIGKPVPTKDLYEDFATGMKNPMSFIKFSRSLHELLPEGAETRAKVNERRQRAVILPHK